MTWVWVVIVTGVACKGDAVPSATELCGTSIPPLDTLVLHGDTPGTFDHLHQLADEIAPHGGIADDVAATNTNMVAFTRAYAAVGDAIAARETARAVAAHSLRADLEAVVARLAAEPERAPPAQQVLVGRAFDLAHGQGEPEHRELERQYGASAQPAEAAELQPVIGPIEAWIAQQQHPVLAVDAPVAAWRAGEASALGADAKVLADRHALEGAALAFAAKDGSHELDNLARILGAEAAARIATAIVQNDDRALAAQRGRLAALHGVLYTFYGLGNGSPTVRHLIVCEVAPRAPAPPRLALDAALDAVARLPGATFGLRSDTPVRPDPRVIGELTAAIGKLP